MVTRLRARVGEYLFAEGEQTWVDALTERLGRRTVATVEIGTGGQLAALLGNGQFVTFAELLRGSDDVSRAATAVTHYAQLVRDLGNADIGLCLFARENRGDTHVRVAIATEDGTHEEQRIAFLGGDEGQRRAALAACSVLWTWLGLGVRSNN
jgi:hypothetical protein